MLVNYLHDLAVAVFFVASLAALFLEREAAGQGCGPAGQGCGPAVHAVCRRLLRVACAAFAVVLAGGVVRTVTFREYEWMEAAGRGQVSALVVKHVILASLAAAALAACVRVRSRLREGGKGRSG